MEYNFIQNGECLLSQSSQMTKYSLFNSSSQLKNVSEVNSQKYQKYILTKYRQNKIKSNKTRTYSRSLDIKIKRQTTQLKCQMQRQKQKQKQSSIQTKEWSEELRNQFFQFQNGFQQFQDCQIHQIQNQAQRQLSFQCKIRNLLCNNIIMKRILKGSLNIESKFTIRNQAGFIVSPSPIYHIVLTKLEQEKDKEYIILDADNSIQIFQQKEIDPLYRNIIQKLSYYLNLNQIYCQLPNKVIKDLEQIQHFGLKMKNKFKQSRMLFYGMQSSKNRSLYQLCEMRNLGFVTISDQTWQQRKGLYSWLYDKNTDWTRSRAETINNVIQDIQDILFADEQNWIKIKVMTLSELNQLKSKILNQKARTKRKKRWLRKINELIVEKQKSLKIKKYETIQQLYLQQFIQQRGCKDSYLNSTEYDKLIESQDILIKYTHKLLTQTQTQPNKNQNSLEIIDVNARIFQAVKLPQLIHLLQHCRPAYTLIINNLSQKYNLELDSIVVNHQFRSFKSNIIKSLNKKINFQQNSLQKLIQYPFDLDYDASLAAKQQLSTQIKIKAIQYYIFEEKIQNSLILSSFQSSILKDNDSLRQFEEFYLNALAKFLSISNKKLPVNQIKNNLLFQSIRINTQSKLIKTLYRQEKNCLSIPVKDCIFTLQNTLNSNQERNYFKINHNNKIQLIDLETMNDKEMIPLKNYYWSKKYCYLPSIIGIKCHEYDVKEMINFRQAIRSSKIQFFEEIEQRKNQLNSYLINLDDDQLLKQFRINDLTFDSEDEEAFD